MNRPRPRRLVSLGSILIDVALEVPHLPERGGDVLAQGGSLSVGGGFNVLSAAARLGLPGIYAGPHGTGAFGDRVRAALAAEGIELAVAARRGADTGYCVAFIEPDGERTFATLTGAEGRLHPEELRQLRYQDGDAVYVSGYDLAYPDAGPALAAHLADLPASVSLTFDPGPLAAEIPPALLGAALARADLVSLNTREAQLLGGADSVLQGAEAVIVRHGPAGATIHLPGEAPVGVPAVMTQAADTTGAGDVHVGATLAGLARGLEIAEAVLFANRAASYAVSRAGPASGPTLRELEEFGRTRW